MLHESYIHPRTIPCTLPSAALGTLWVLFMFHVELSVLVLRGTIMLTAPTGVLT